MQNRKYIKYEVKEIEQQTQDVYTVHLRPIQQKVPEYEPGQFFMIKNENLAEGIKPRIKPYSALHPHNENELCFGVKKHQQFSCGLCNLKIKDQVECLGPFGFFTLPNLDQDVEFVFLAGGIGITPLLTMIESLNMQKQKRKHYLFYSNRTAQDIAYFEQLQKIQKENEYFEFICTLTAQQGLEEWKGEKGRISIDMIKKYVKDFEKTHFFMCANKEFIEQMQKALLDANIAKEQIHFEKW